jgi:hypothetical protein
MALTRGQWATLMLPWLVATCSKPDAPPHRTAPWLASPSASSAVGRGPRAYRFASDSAVRFSVSGQKGKITGRVPLRRGELHLDPHNLELVSASADFDLSALSIETDAPDAPDAPDLGGATPSTLARQWLELGAEVPAERRAQFENARFELSAVENLSHTFLELGSARKPSSVRATAVGTLLIHGFRAPVRLEVLLGAAPSSASDAPRLSIRSATALVIQLAPHDITARDAAGIVDALGRARSAEWIGKTARVDFELTAEPVATAAK